MEIKQPEEKPTVKTKRKLRLRTHTSKIRKRKSRFENISPEVAVIKLWAYITSKWKYLISSGIVQLALAGLVISTVAKLIGSQLNAKDITKERFTVLCITTFQLKMIQKELSKDKHQ